VTTTAGLLIVLAGTISMILGAPTTTVLVTLMVVSTQAISGIAVLRRAATPQNAVGFGALAVAIGIGLSAASDVALHGSPLDRVAWAVPSVIALPFVGYRSLEPQSGASVLRHVAEAFPLIAIATLLSMMHDYYWTIIPAMGLTAIAWSTGRWTSRHAQPSARGRTLAVGLTLATGAIVVLGSRWSGPHEPWLLQRKDFVFFRALAWSLNRYGASENPLLAGTPLHYHWLSYAWIGSLEQLTPGSTWPVLTMIGPAMACVLLVAITWGWISARANGASAAMAIALLALFDTPRLWSVGVHAARLESFSAVFGGMYLMGIPLILAGTASLRAGAVCASLCGLLAFTSKFSHGAIAGAGLALIAVLRSANRRRAILNVALLAFAFLALAVSVFGVGISQRGDSLSLGPLSFPWLARPELLVFDGWQYVPIAATLILGFLLIPLTALVRFGHGGQSRSNDEVFCNAAIIAGVLLFVLLARVEATQGFFLHSALLLAAPLGATLLTGRESWLLRSTPVRGGVLIALLSALIVTTWRGPDGGGRVAVALRLIPLLAPLVGVGLPLGVLAISMRRRGFDLTRVVAALVFASSVGIGLGNWLLDAPEYFREREALAGQSVGGPLVDQLKEATDQLTEMDDVLATNHSLCDGSRCDATAWKRSITSDCRLSPDAIGSGSCYLSYAPPLAALLERRFWVDGFSFLSTGTPTTIDLQRASDSLALSQRPGVDSVAPLREAGVTWFIVDKELPHAADYGAVGKTRYENARFIVLELHDR
jgi:hypothetical protein